MPILATDDFTSAELTDIINDVETPKLFLQSIGVFETKGIRTTSLEVERCAGGLQLVKTSGRGTEDGTSMTGNKRDLIKFNSVRLMVKDTIEPDDLQDIRRFGEGADGLEQVEEELSERSTRMREVLEVNLERQRFGAIQGKVLDSDGTVIHDLFTKFDYKQTVIEVAFGDASNLEAQVLAAKNAADKAIKGKPRKGYIALCGADFTDKLHLNKDFKDAYRIYQDSVQARTDMRECISYRNIDWMKCNDGIGETPYIAADEAYLFPVVQGMFVERYTAADIMWAVNQKGLQFYLTQDELKHGMGVELWARSFPIILNTIPHAVIKLKVK